MKHLNISAWSDVFWFSFWYVGAWWVVLWLPFWYMWLFFLLLNEKMAFAFVYLVQFPVSRKLQLIDLHIKLSKLWDTFGTRDCDQFVSWRGSLQCKPQHELPDFLVLWPNVRNVRTYCATVRAHEGELFTHGVLFQTDFRIDVLFQTDRLQNWRHITPSKCIGVPFLSANVRWRYRQFP